MRAVGAATDAACFELVDQMLEFFAIEPDLDLDIMRPNQSLVELTSRLLLSVHDAIAREQPARFGRARAWGKAGIDRVDIE